MKKFLIFSGLAAVCLFILLKKEQMFMFAPAEKETTANASGLKLIKTSFGELKNWNLDSQIDAAESFRRSCKKIINENKKFMSDAELRLPTDSYKKICQKFLKKQPIDTPSFKKFIEENFTPFLVTENGKEKGKFTSYFEASVNASRIPDKTYKYPIYGKPFDLVEINLKDFDSELPNRRLVGRIENQKFVPYYTRREIEKNKINAPVLLWGDSLIDIHIMQIQGSAVAKLNTGEKVRIGYAENNGLPFKGIGSVLLEKGLVKPGEASMSHIKKWLKNNPGKAEENLHENNRYIFHRLTNSDGPIGAHGVALQAGRSLAVDRKYIPLGALLWLETTGPDKEKIEKLVVAQDIGSAIKGIVRGDYFWGSGADDVLDKAGRMNSTGRYFIFIPKEMEKLYE